MAAQNGVFHFIGLRSGQTYDVSAYFDDTAGNLVRFNQAGKAGATSPDFWDAPEPVVLRDIVLAAATGQTITQLLRGGKPTGDYFLNAIHLASVVTRPVLNIPFYPSVGRVSATQLA